MGLLPNSMENLNNYYEERKKNRRACLDEKKAQESKYKRHLEKVAEKINYLKSSIENILDNEQKILDIEGKRNRLIKGLNEVRDIHSDFYDSLRSLIDTAPSEVFRYARKKTEMEVKKDISKVDRQLKNYLENIILVVNELSKIVSHAMGPVDIESENSLKITLSEIQEITDIKDYRELEKVIKKLKSGLRNSFVQNAEKYQKSLETKKIPFEGRMQKIAELNNKLLEEECRKINEGIVKRRADYFNSLEGIVLSFCTYQLELKNSREDDFYTIFLEDKAFDKLSLLKNRQDKEVMDILKNFNEKGNINNDEYISIKKILENELGKKEIIEKTKREKIKAESIEDIGKRANFIADYKIPLNKALEIAKLIKDESLVRIPRELAANLDGPLAELLIQYNPELFLMDEKEINKYLDSFRSTRKLVKRFEMIADFNPYNSPKNFASFNALGETRRKFSEMAGEFAKTRRREFNAGEETSEVGLIKRDLAREGFDADMVLVILRRGFYFKNQYFTGDHKINEEHLEKNTKKDKNIDFEKRDFKRELRKLITSGAVISNRGYSLNDKTKEIPNNTLRRAIQYILTHHPLEEEN